MSEGRRVIALLALITVIWFANLGKWDLWGPDEPRYAQVAREMMRSGDFIVPHLNGQIYGEKPPLFFWAVAASSALLDRDGHGPSPLAARLPSAIAGLGVLLLTYLLARRIYDPSVALLSVFILFSTVQFTASATDAHLDALLTFWTTATIFLFFEGYRRPSGGRVLFLLSYASMGLAVLAKGPVGIIVPVLSIGFFILAKRDVSILRRIELVKGCVILAAVVGLWLVPAGIMGGKEYFNYIVFTQNAGRAVKSFSHAAPFYYYGDVFLADFLPWSLFLPFAIVYFFETRRVGLGLPSLIWFAATFLFFSLMSGKRSLYLLPLYPAASIMMARFCADRGRVDREGKAHRPMLLLIPCVLFFGALFLAACLTTLKWTGILELPVLPGQLPDLLYATVLLLGLMGISGMILLLRGVRVEQLVRLTVASSVVLIAAILLQPYPLPDANYSLKPFAQRIEKRLKPDGRILTTFSPELFNYFLDKCPIDSIPEDRVEALVNDDPGILVLIRARTKRLSERGPQWLQDRTSQILDSAVIGNTTYYLVGRPPAESAGPVSSAGPGKTSDPAHSAPPSDNPGSRK